MNTLRLVGYVRVSTIDQAERGHGLDVQRRAISKWARVHGHRVVRFYEDAGLSGSNGLDSRVSLADALASVRSREADALIVYRLDRLARDLVLQETLLAEIKRLGGRLLSTSAAEADYLVDDPEDPSRRLIRQVLGAVSEYERSMIALRLASGRRRKGEKGGFAYGAPPFGTRAENGELVVDEAEQAVVRRVREMHAAGRSIRWIAEALTLEGVPTKSGRDGTRWHPTTVARVLARTAA